MSRHDSPPSRRDDFSGMPFPPSGFSGEPRDVPVPREFIPALARGLMTPPPVAVISGTKEAIAPPELLEPGFAEPEELEEETRPVSPTMADNPELAPLLDLLVSGQSGNPAPPDRAGKPAVASTLSIQELAGSLLTPPAAPARSLPARPKKVDTPAPPPSAPTPSPPAFSLADLAGQLSSRFVDQPTGGVGDLMAPSPGFLSDQYPDTAPGAPDEAADDWSMDMLLPNTLAKPEPAPVAATPPAPDSGLATAFSLASGLVAPPASDKARPSPLVPPSPSSAQSA